MARLAFPRRGHHAEMEIDSSTDLRQIQIHNASLRTASGFPEAVPLFPLEIGASKTPVGE